VTVTDGPFTEAKEVVGGYAQFEQKSKERQSNRRSLHGTSQETLARLGKARPRFVRCSGRRLRSPGIGALTNRWKTGTTASATGGGGKKFLIIALIGGADAGGLAAALGHKSGSSSTPSSVSNPPGTVLVPGTPSIQPPH